MQLRDRKSTKTVIGTSNVFLDCRQVGDVLTREPRTRALSFNSIMAESLSVNFLVYLTE